MSTSLNCKIKKGKNPKTYCNLKKKKITAILVLVTLKKHNALKTSMSGMMVESICFLAFGFYFMYRDKNILLRNKKHMS